MLTREVNNYNGLSYSSRMDCVLHRGWDIQTVCACISPMASYVRWNRSAILRSLIGACGGRGDGIGFHSAGVVGICLAKLIRWCSCWFGLINLCWVICLNEGSLSFVDVVR